MEPFIIHSIHHFDGVLFFCTVLASHSLRQCDNYFQSNRFAHSLETIANDFCIFPILCSFRCAFDSVWRFIFLIYSTVSSHIFDRFDVNGHRTSHWIRWQSRRIYLKFFITFAEFCAVPSFTLLDCSFRCETEMGKSSQYRKKLMLQKYAYNELKFTMRMQTLKQCQQMAISWEKWWHIPK